MIYDRLSFPRQKWIEKDKSTNSVGYLHSSGNFGGIANETERTINHVLSRKKSGTFRAHSMENEAVEIAHSSFFPARGI